MKLSEALKIDSEAYAINGIVHYSEDTEEPCICMECKEHASVIRVVVDDEEVDTMSNCCGADCHIW